MSPLLIYQPLGSDPNILARFSSATTMLHKFISGCGIQFFLKNKLSSYFGKDTLWFTVLSSNKNLVYAGGLWSKSVLVSPSAAGIRQTANGARNIESEALLNCAIFARKERIS